MRLTNIPKKRSSRIFALILLLLLPLVLVFYLGSSRVQATESSWEVVTGKDKVTNSTVMPWFGPSPYLYTIPTTSNEVILAPHTRFYIEPWTPKGKKEGYYVWQLNLNTLSIKPVLYENFISLQPKLYNKPIKIWENLIKLARDYDLVKDTLYGETLIEAISFNSQEKKYRVELTVSNFRRIDESFLGLSFISNKLKRKQALSYSGVMHLKILDLSKTKSLSVELTKQFNYWSYPLRGDPKKYTLPSIIASFTKLYILPDLKPCFMLVSPAYKGRIYKERLSIEDTTFKLIIP